MIAGVLLIGLCLFDRQVNIPLGDTSIKVRAGIYSVILLPFALLWYLLVLFLARELAESTLLQIELQRQPVFHLACFLLLTVALRICERVVYSLVTWKPLLFSRIASTTNGQQPNVVSGSTQTQLGSTPKEVTQSISRSLESFLPKSRLLREVVLISWGFYMIGFLIYLCG